MSDWLDRLARASASNERVSRRQLVRPHASAVDAAGGGRLDTVARALAEPMPRRRMLQLTGAAVAGLALPLRVTTGVAEACTGPNCAPGLTPCPLPRNPPDCSDPYACCRPEEVCCPGLGCCPRESNFEVFRACGDAQNVCLYECPTVRCGTRCCPPRLPRCVDSECRPAQRCPGGRVRCGKRCCPKGEKCHSGRCRPCPPGQIKCKKCCPPGEGCHVDTGECICPDKFLCKRPGFSGKGVCCGMEAECLEHEGRCCPYQRVCRKRGDPEVAKTCCEPGQHCVDGRCEKCPRRTKPCGDLCCSGQETCKSFDGGFANLCRCPRGTRSCGTTISGVSRQCCPDTHRCTETGCARCPKGTHPCGRICCPNSLVCNWPLATTCIKPERTLVEEIIYLDDPVPEQQVIRLDRPATDREPLAIAGKNGSLDGIAIRCRGPVRCSGKITLTEATVRGSAGAIAAARRSKTVARGRYHIPAGATKTLRLRLDRRRLAQLKKARFLRVRATIADSKGKRRYPPFLIARP